MVNEFSHIVERNKTIFPGLGACRKIYCIDEKAKLTKTPIFEETLINRNQG